MSRILARLLAVWMVLVSTARASGPPLTALQVVNDSGAELVVYVDGSFRGNVRIADQRSFTTPPGAHDVQITWTDRTPILRDRVVTSLQRPTVLRVPPPVVPVVLTNSSPGPVWLDLAGREADLWLLPGARHTVHLPIGTTSPLTTSVYGPRGLVPVQQLDLVARAGATVEVGFYAPPPASTITLTNQDARTLRVYIAGQEVAMVPPGQTRAWEVAPGRFDVLVVEERGRVLFQQAVTFDPRRDHNLRVVNGRGVMDNPRYLAAR